MTGSAPNYELLLAHLRSASTGLVPAERRVAEVVIRQLHRLEEYSAVALAAEANCSAATVVRACQRMGFSGFQQLRLQSIRAAATHAPAWPTEPDRIAASAAPEGALEQVVHQALAEVHAVAKVLDRVNFDRTVTALAGASRILVLGSGAAQPLAQDTAAMLRASGRTVLREELELTELNAQDICLVVSYSAATEHVLQLVRTAAQAGSRVIAVTGSADSALAELADLTLVAGTPTDRAQRFSGRIGPLLVRNALLLALHQLSGKLPAAAGELTRQDH